MTPIDISSDETENLSDSYEFSSGLSACVRRWDIVGDDLQLIKKIYKGLSGEVWAAKSTRNESIYAVKIMLKRGPSMKARRVCELNDILSASCSSSVNLFALVLRTSSIKRRRCLVFEKYGMSLSGLICHAELFPILPCHFTAISWQICDALAFLHRVDVIHTDIKPDNIVLVDDKTTSVVDMDATGTFGPRIILFNPQIKIIDLEDAVSSSGMSRHCAGTIRYRAPEIYARLRWSSPIDVFALGCTLYELNEGCPLFPQVTTLRDILVFLERTIGKIDWEFSNTLRKVQPDLFLDPLKNELRPPLPEDTNTTEIRAASHLLARVRSPDLCDLIKLCLIQNPTKRANLSRIKSHRMFGCLSTVV